MRGALSDLEPFESLCSPLCVRGDLRAAQCDSLGRVERGSLKPPCGCGADWLGGADREDEGGSIILVDCGNLVGGGSFGGVDGRVPSGQRADDAERLFTSELIGEQHSIEDGRGADRGCRFRGDGRVVTAAHFLLNFGRFESWRMAAESGGEEALTPPCRLTPVHPRLASWSI